jgi:large subunit ribosomal protein L32
LIGNSEGLIIQVNKLLHLFFKEVGIMAVPARRTSKTVKRKRRTHFKLQVPGMVACPNCGEMKLSHRVCKECGNYKGKDVVNN